MYSGDPTMYSALVGHIRSKLNSSPKRWSLHEVMSVVEDAYGAVIDRKVELRIPIRPFGITSLQDLTSAKYAAGHALIAEIKELFVNERAAVVNELYDDPTYLLVCGFDENNEPHIFSADPVGNCTLHDAHTFHAIGMNHE